MKGSALLILAGAGLLAGAAPARAATGVAPPALYPAELWEGKTVAVIRVLERLDAHVETLRVPVGGSATYGALTVGVSSCVDRPQTLAADSAARLHLAETGSSAPPVFDGWMLANEPSLGTYGSALYDVRMVSCEGEGAAPLPGPLPVAKAPLLSSAAPVEEEGGDAGVLPVSSAAPGAVSGTVSGPVPLAPESAPIPLAPPDEGAQPLAPPAPPLPGRGTP